MSATFYYQTGFCVATWWILVSSAMRQPVYSVFESSVVTVPKVVPKAVMLFLQRFRPFIFNCETIGLALAGCFPEHDSVRVVAALLYTLYHLIESSQTNLRKHLVLWAMWAMCIPNPEDRQALIWGIAINFISLSGYAKITSGGLSSHGSPAWIHSTTMESYLTFSRLHSRTSFDGPVYPKLNEQVSNSRVLTSLISFATLLLELLLVPASLAMTPSSRMLTCYAFIGMHIVVGVLTSFKAAANFFTTIPVYLYGFSCGSHFGTKPWILACLVGLGPVVLSILQMPLPEEWPFTGAAAFMWDGTTAQILFRLLMTEDTRMVLTTQKVASEGLEGLRVLHHGEFAAHGEAVVHDSVHKTICLSMSRGGEPMLEAIRTLQYDPKLSGAPTHAFVHRTWATLNFDRRLVEAHTGEDLSQVYLVRVNADGRVTGVII